MRRVVLEDMSIELDEAMKYAGHAMMQDLL